MEEDLVLFGQWLQQTLKQFGISQDEVCKTAHIGHTTLCNLYKGKMYVSVS